MHEAEVLVPVGNVNVLNAVVVILTLLKKADYACRKSSNFSSPLMMDSAGSDHADLVSDHG